MLLISKKIFKHLLLAGLIPLFIVSCGGSSDDATGTISVRMTDAPIDGVNVKVYVQFSAIELHGEAGRQRIEYNPPKQIELTQLTEGNTADFINSLEIPTGRYQWIRLDVDTDQDMDTYIDINGTPFELTIPSGDNNGLKLHSSFDVVENEHSIYVIDFDLRKSITVTVNGQNISYKLRPTLRLLDESRVGVITGTVDLANYSCDDTGNAVYIYEGLDQLPDDEGSNNPPIASAQVKYDDATQTYKYIAAFVHHGEYTVALTCMADMDDAETDDDIVFFDPQNASVIKRNTLTIDFPSVVAP